MVREHTNKLLEMVEEGVLDKDTVILKTISAPRIEEFDKQK